MTGKRALGLVVAALLAVAGWSAPAGAGSLSPVDDRYEPGEEATLVGYVAPPPDGWEAAGPYMAFFKELGPLSTSVRIGPLDVAEVDTPAGRALRVSLVFRVPPDTVPGYYEVTYCDRLCTGGLGDLAGSHPLNVGVDPAAPIVREWARNEPEIARLPAEAVVAGAGFRATAAELRAPATTAGPVTTTPTTVVTATSVSRRVVVPASTVPLGPPTSPATSQAEGNGWFVVLGMAGALACTAAVLVAMRPPPARAPVRA
ncbi:MAG: hypothetical protein ACLGI2_15320 [Acidimicrobiia bacterium]